MPLRVALPLVLLLAGAVPARALVFDDGGVHAVTTPVPGKDGVSVRDGPGPAATQVTVSTAVEAGVAVTGISEAIVDTATTGGSVFALDDASLTVVHSDVGNDVYANDQAQALVDDTDVSNNIFALGYAEIEVSASRIGDPMESGDVFANQSAAITMHSGTFVRNNVFTNDTAWIRVQGADIGGRLFANGASQIDFSGGSVGEEIESYGASTVRIVGADFAVDGTPAPFGAVSALSGTLTGSLADGSPLDAPFLRDDTATLLLVAVPEPAAAAMLIVGAAVLAAARASSPRVSTPAPRTPGASPLRGMPGTPRSFHTADGSRPRPVSFESRSARSSSPASSRPRPKQEKRR